MGTLPQGVPGAEDLRRRRHRGEVEPRERPAPRHPAKAQGIIAAAAAAVVQGQAQRAQAAGEIPDSWRADEGGQWGWLAR